jgi:3-phosphoshikimate 1-carboxyvinyltransferase
MPLPDLIEIVPLTAPVRAEITVPGSKSITNRALILAALADGETILKGALWSEDTQIMAECLQELGFMVNVEADPNEPCNRTITVYGSGGAVPRGGTEAQPLELFVGNAGTAARFLAPFLCLGSGVYRLHGVPRMHERPQAALFSALRELGYRVEAEKGNDKLPVKIFGGSSRGNEAQTEKAESGKRKAEIDQSLLKLAAVKKCRVSIEESSQFASALLLSAKHGGWEIEIVGENAEESPYVAMTTKLIEVFPNGGEFQIEPDASSGSYFLAAARLFPIEEEVEEIVEDEILNPLRRRMNVKQTRLGDIKVLHWPDSGWQIDQKFREFVLVGAMIRLYRKTPSESATLEEMLEFCSQVSRKADLGDSIMTAIAMTPLGAGAIAYNDLARLRVQECERVVALRTELTKCGAKVVEEGDTLTVYPSKLEELHGAEIETYNDHRMAMCFAVLGLKVPGMKIKNPDCVKKTFPNFFQKLAAAPPHGLGATILDAKTGRKLTHEELFAD